MIFQTTAGTEIHTKARLFVLIDQEESIVSADAEAWEVGSRATLELVFQQDGALIINVPKTAKRWHACVLKTDNVVSLQDFFVSAAYWVPQDGIIKLTPDSIQEAYQELAKLGITSSHHSEYKNVGPEKPVQKFVSVDKIERSPTDPA